MCRVVLSDTLTLQRKETKCTSKRQTEIYFEKLCLCRNSWKRMVLTVQVDVVRFTPFAPQRRIVEAGAANLDGVVQSGLQIQRGPGLSRCRHHLETAERESAHTRASVYTGTHQTSWACSCLRAMTESNSAVMVT